MASSVWREAIMDDGCYVMSQVTTRLYDGDNLRPDRYYQRIPKGGGYTGYMKHFNKKKQRDTIESSGEATDYDIKQGVKYYDISLQWLILQKLCRLPHSSRLYKNLNKLHSLRNQVAHSRPNDKVYELDEKLTYLGALYDDILDDLEDETGDNLWEAKQEVMRRIGSRKRQQQQAPEVVSVVSYDGSKRAEPSTHDPSQDFDFVEDEGEDEDFMGTFEKVAVGLGMIRGLALESSGGGSAYKPNNDNSNRMVARRRQTPSNDDDDDLGNFGKAAVGIGLGGAIGLGAGLLASYVSTYADDDTEENKPRQQKAQQQKEQEEKPVNQGWGAMGAALGAGIGLLGAIASMDFNEKPKEPSGRRYQNNW